VSEWVERRDIDIVAEDQERRDGEAFTPRCGYGKPATPKFDWQAHHDRLSAVIRGDSNGTARVAGILSTMSTPEQRAAARRTVQLHEQPLAKNKAALEAEAKKVSEAKARDPRESRRGSFASGKATGRGGAPVPVHVGTLPLPGVLRRG
jgi:hypothetical protein